MSQNSAVVANVAGAAYRAAVNNALDTLLNNNSGASAPATTQAGMFWYDTTNAVVKQRNAANSGWITRWTVANAEGVFGGAVTVGSTLGVVDTLSITGPTGGSAMVWSGPTTGKLGASASNTSGSIVWGVESSTGGSLMGGTSAYAAVLGTTVNKNLEFCTNNLMRGGITGAGAFFIGSSTAINTEILRVDGGASNAAAFKSSAGAGGAVALFWNSATSGDNLFTQFFTEGTLTTRGSIDFNRGGTAVRYNTTSDARLKDKNGPAQYDPSWITRVASSIFDVTWKETGYRVDTFVAQDLHAVEPDAVKKGDDAPELQHGEDGRMTSDIWGVDPSKLVAKTILEVAALRREFDAYKSARP